jgi:queuine tRNA-ribosyltransferase
MSFDECAPANAEKYYLRDAMNRTHRWLERCRIHHEKLDFAKQFQTLVPIIQGGVFDELRAESAHFINSFEWSAYAIGGLSVGESKEDMMRTLEVTIPILPEEKPKYLMGVGTPEDLLEAVSRGVDMFDCVLATRLARHGTFWAHDENGKFQKFHIKNEKFKFDPNPLDGDFTFSKLKNFSKSYIRHLIMCNEILGLRILSIHNLFVLLDLMKKTRQAIEEDTFHELCERYL